MIDNQSGLISNNTSIVSHPVSRNLFAASRAQQPSQFHPDSTDNLVQEILRQRTQRLNAGGQQKQKDEKNQYHNQIYNQESSKVLEHQDSNHQSQQFSKKSTIRIENNPLNSEEKLNNHSKQSIKQESYEKKLEVENQHIQIQDNVEVLNNQTNPDFNLTLDQHNNSGQAIHEDQTHNQFNLPNINNKSEKSADHSHKSILPLIEQNKQQILEGQFIVGQDNYQFNKKENIEKQSSIFSKLNTEKNLSQSEMKSKNKSIEVQVKQNESLQNIIGQSQLIARSESNHSKEMRREIGGSQSKIQAKNSVIKSPRGNFKENQGFYDFTPIPNRNQTDVDLVKAIAAQLNQIDHEESNNQNIFRKSSKNIVEGNELESHHKTSQVNQSKRTIHMQQFETQYSQNIRDVKILEHRQESNIQFQIAQLKEMIMLYQALITDQQCKDTRKMIKQLEMSNRREKISLRAGSYSKRFNFHSPILKNNHRPIEFKTKFVVSERLADKYYGTKKLIADEKLHHVALQDKLQVLNDYYDMMKSKKIKSYQQTLKQYEYNSKLQKYQTVKNGFFHKSSLKETPRKSQYEFNKTKRTIEFNETDIPYHQVLKFKIDISKDMILQYQVWSMGKIKKLRDENTLIKKEVQYVDQLIKQVDKQFLQIFGIKSVKSASKHRISSPNATTKKFSFSNRSSEKSPAGFRRPITPLDSPQKNSLNVSSSSKSNKLLSPNKGKQFRKETEKIEGNQLLLIDSVQLDYSKRKAMRILQQCDDYGMGPIQEQSKVIEDIPTFGKKQALQMVVSLQKSQSRSKSRNLVRPASRQIKTQTSLPKSPKTRLKTKISQQSSPRKALAQSQYYTSMDDILSKKSK